MLRFPFPSYVAPPTSQQASAVGPARCARALPPRSSLLTPMQKKGVAPRRFLSGIRGRTKPELCRMCLCANYPVLRTSLPPAYTPPRPCHGCYKPVPTVAMTPTGSRALVLTAAFTAAALLLPEAQAWSSNVNLNAAHHATTASPGWSNRNAKHQHQRRSPRCRSFEEARSTREGNNVGLGAYGGPSM